MSNYSSLTSEIIQETKARDRAQPLINDKCESQFFFHPHPTVKVCLFFHGITATPEQFLPIGEAFFQAGYNVLIPLLPGHGVAGNWNHSNPPPLPKDEQVYKQFALQWLQQVQELGEQVIVGGLSGGSTLAAWLALERPEEIYRALVCAPYLSATNKLVDLIVQNLDFYFQWKRKPGIVGFGYDGFELPAMRVFFDMGQDVIKRAEKRVAAPMLVLSSESDRAVGKEDHKALFEEAVKLQPKTWYYCFSRALDVGHNMMTKAEGNEHVDLVIAITKAYVESDLTWAEVMEMGLRLKQGNTFNTIVNDLNLSQRISPDMNTMMEIATN